MEKVKIENFELKFLKAIFVLGLTIHMVVPAASLHIRKKSLVIFQTRLLYILFFLGSCNRSALDSNQLKFSLNKNLLSFLVNL